MKIQLVSDLHLEFSDITIPNVGNTDVLILGGDILVAEKLMRANSEKGQVFREFLARCSAEFPHVIYIAGNHEFYGSGKFWGSVDDLREYTEAHHDNVHFLERDTRIIDGVVFIGGTLWTDMNKNDPLTLHTVRSGMNDYRAILDDRRGYTHLRPQETVAHHHRTLEYFRSELKKYADHKCVIVSHHTPSRLSINPQYQDDHHMNGAYHSDLSEFILDHPQIRLWTCGHTHHAHQYQIGETRVVCNPRGYETDNFKEQTGFDPNLQLDLDHLPTVA
jgi:DNA repair exonuclease SbcCD nuclease subunit